MAAEYFDDFICLSCEGEPEFGTPAEAIEHIKKVHGGVTQGRKVLVMHVDYERGQYESAYEWQFEKFLKCLRGLAKRSPARKLKFDLELARNLVLE